MAPWWIRPTSDDPDSLETDAARPAEELPTERPAAESRAAQDEPATSAAQRRVRRRGSTRRRRPGRGESDARPSEAPPVDRPSPAALYGLEDAESEPAEPSPRKKSAPRRSRKKSARRETADADTPSQRNGGAKPEPVSVQRGRERQPPPAARGRGDRDKEENADLETILREIFLEAPDRRTSEVDERKIALFCDFENIALGVRDSKTEKFDINLVLERLLEKGKIIVKKAYSDWQRYSEYKRTFHEAGIELIDIPQKHYSGKNSADIKMVVDAMDLCYSKEHLDTFVIMSGDSDFSPLVSKLKENNKYVIGVGVKNASSNLLIDNCDEFIYYEDVWRDAQKLPHLDGLSKKHTEVFNLLTDAMQALIRENKEVLWGSMIKQTMQRKKPSFNEGYYGYSTFSELLEDAEDKGIVRLKDDKRSGSYIVTGFGDAR